MTIIDTYKISGMEKKSTASDIKGIGVALLLSSTIPALFIVRGSWLQHRASTLALWIMFVMTVPQFADKIAPVPTTHNPEAFLVVSIAALLANAALFVYQIIRISNKKLNPLKAEIYADTKSYKKVLAENV